MLEEKVNPSPSLSHAILYLNRGPYSYSFAVGQSRRSFRTGKGCINRMKGKGKEQRGKGQEGKRGKAKECIYENTFQVMILLVQNQITYISGNPKHIQMQGSAH